MSWAQKEKPNTIHIANIEIKDFCLLKDFIGKNIIYSNLRRNEYIKNFWKYETTVTSVRKWTEGSRFAHFLKSSSKFTRRYNKITPSKLVEKKIIHKKLDGRDMADKAIFWLNISGKKS